MKKKEQNAAPVEMQKEKPVPAYLRPEYPYQAIGEPITDPKLLKETGILYEIKCPQCEMSIRSQGVNIRRTYEKMMKENGCIGCGNKELIIREVDMSGMQGVRKNESCQAEACQTEESGD